jgi:hypothetical protein
MGHRYDSLVSLNLLIANSSEAVGVLLPTVVMQAMQTHYYHVLEKYKLEILLIFNSTLNLDI